MKKAAAIIIVIFVALGLAWSGFCIVDDAVHGRGSFMSTATYREHVQEGKGPCGR